MPGMFRSITTTSGAISRTMFEGLLARRGLADDLHALVFQEVAKTTPEEIVVVDDQDADVGQRLLAGYDGLTHTGRSLPGRGRGEV